MMTSILSGDSYFGLIQIPSYNLKLDYYFFAADDFSRLYKSPALADKSPYGIYIGKDTVSPVIFHTPAEYYFEKVDSVIFKARIEDNLGVDTVYVEYRINDGPLRFAGLMKGELNEYSLSLSVKQELLKGGDILKYRIVAFDEASERNSVISPVSDYYTIKIEALLSVISSYATDFSDASADFFNSGFEIAQPSNFNSQGLHTEHPYQSPDEDYKSLEFSSVLRHPVIFDASGMIISFRELVLVEPGAEGSVFGFSDFYDYVIVEASKDYGMTWFSLADGYDSMLIPSWENAYNSEIFIQNSRYAGKESMMLSHSFYPRIPDRISDGDSLLIRFRLFSDPYANGWGWVIDDLKINPLVDHVEEIHSSGITVFPNPGNGMVNISFEDDYTSRPARISVYDYSGRCLIQEASFDGKMIMLNLSENSPGLYFIVINYGQITKAVKYYLSK
jgi:hypothetical protein